MAKYKFLSSAPFALLLALVLGHSALAKGPNEAKIDPKADSNGVLLGTSFSFESAAEGSEVRSGAGTQLTSLDGKTAPQVRDISTNTSSVKRAPNRQPLDAQERTAKYFDSIADNGAALRVLLQAMPKGADLHNHLGGAIYAEDMMRWAAESGLCFDKPTDRFVKGPCLGGDQIAAKDLPTDYPLYSHVIDILSTRGYEQQIGNPKTQWFDRFFSAFIRFSPAIASKPAEALAAAREAAANDNVRYLELMVNVWPAPALGSAAEEAGKDGTDFNAMFEAISPLMTDVVLNVRKEYNSLEVQVNKLEACNSQTPSPACNLTVRYLYPALRNIAPARVFAQLALGFALVQADPRFVGVNIIAPEHEPIPRRDYELHMRMLSFLKTRYPSVPLALHAGELTLGLVPPRDLRFHVSEAVNVGKAQRIGHGVSIPYEPDAILTLKKMAREKIPVEINLTSNAVILGVKGANHPLSLYRTAGVPIVLSTDDEGVSRGDMTNEYLRAVTEQKFRYLDLKLVSRNGLEYAFIPGASIWRSGPGSGLVASCDTTPVNEACAIFLERNAKARLQLELEKDFDAFENSQPPF